MNPGLHQLFTSNIKALTHYTETAKSCCENRCTYKTVEKIVAVVKKMLKYVWKITAFSVVSCVVCEGLKTIFFTSQLIPLPLNVVERDRREQDRYMTII